MFKSQNQMIGEYLKAGHSITPLEALEKFGCFRLGARIADLKKQGFDIDTKIVKNEGTGKRYASYSLTVKAVEKARIHPVNLNIEIKPICLDGELF